MTRARVIPDTITVHVPFHIVKRGGRKEMVWPNNKPDKAQLPRKTVPPGTRHVDLSLSLASARPGRSEGSHPGDLRDARPLRV